MRKARIAEWILGLVTTKDRAAATVGDLMEPSRGPVWFWASVIGTFASSIWKQFRAEPMRIACMGAAGFALTLGVWILILRIESEFIPVFSWQWRLVQHVNTLSMCLLGGRWLARHAKGCALAACLAFMVVQLILSTAIRYLGFKPHLDPVALTEFLVALFSGAIWARCRPTVIL